MADAIRASTKKTDILIAILGALGVACFAGAARAVTAPGFPLDDAWIHQTYARNLAERGEWAFVPGIPSAASTSPLYTILLTAGYALGLNHFLWVLILGVVALAGSGWLSSRLASQLYPDVPRVGLWTGLAVVTTWQLVWAAASGMETMLFGMLSLTVVSAAWSMPLPNAAWQTGSVLTGFSQGVRWPRKAFFAPRVRLSDGRLFQYGFGVASRKGWVWHAIKLGFFGGLLTLTRPEGAVLVALAFLTVSVSSAAMSSRQHLKEWAIWLAAGLTIWFLVVLPYLVLNWHVEGALLPSTSAAKQAEYAAARESLILERYTRLLLPLLIGGQVLLVPGGVLGGLLVWRRARSVVPNWKLILPALWVVLLVTAYALRLPVAYQHGRYVMPALPFTILFGVGGTIAHLHASRRSLTQRIFWRTVTLAAIAVFPMFMVIGAQQYGRDVRIINAEMVATARWVRDELPPEELLAVHDIGALGYFAPRPIVDLAGLISPEVVPIIRDHEGLMRLMCERGVRYLMVFPDQRPAAPDDPRLGGAPIFETRSPYAPASGGGNMAVYALVWPPACE